MTSTTDNFGSVKPSGNKASTVVSSCPPEEHASVDSKGTPTHADNSVKLFTSSQRGHLIGRGGYLDLPKPIIWASILAVSMVLLFHTCVLLVFFCNNTMMKQHKTFGLEVW
jgi:hypothetical protein